MFISKNRLEKIEADIKTLYEGYEKIEKDMDMMRMNSTRNTHAIHALLIYFNLKAEDKTISDYSVYPLAQDFALYIIKPMRKNEKTQKKKKLGNT